ncbi:MAG: PPC domain-containing protein, partial [Actinomycetota bacterium]
TTEAPTTEAATEAPTTEAATEDTSEEVPPAPPAPTPPPAPSIPEATDAPTSEPAPAAPPGGSDDMSMGESANGEITDAVPSVDFFFDAASGAAVEISMVALADSLDPVLRLYDPSGALVDENDDFDFSESRNSRISTTLPVDGQYRIEATSFAGTTGPFEVTLTFPSVLTDSDELSEAVPEISYEYDGVAGQRIRIDMVGTNEQTDPLLRLIGPDGSEVAQDDDGGEGLNARLEYTIEVPGTYTVVATAFASGYGPYEITLTEF